VPSSLGFKKYLPVYMASYSSIWISSHCWEPVFQFCKIHNLYFPLMQVCSVSYILVYCHCFCPTHSNWFKLKCVMPTYPYYVLHRYRITFPLEKCDMLISVLEEAAVILFHYELSGHCTQAKWISSDRAYSYVYLVVCGTVLLLPFTFILWNLWPAAKRIFLTHTFSAMHGTCRALLDRLVTWQPFAMLWTTFFMQYLCFYWFILCLTTEQLIEEYLWTTVWKWVLEK